MTVWNIIVGLLSGFLGSIGIGGGSVLIIYLTLFCEMNQLKAQGINLMFFIPVAITGLIFHLKNKLVDWKKAVPLIIFGLIGVTVGYFLSKKIDETMIRKIFGAFLLFLALLQLLSIRKSHKSKNNSSD